ncbi:MAG: TldD/PmbA family protein [Promethearchaeota archaeon]
MEFNKELLLEKGQFVLKESENLGASQTEVQISKNTLGLTRLANSIIDQNIAEHHTNVQIVIYFGKKLGSVNVEVFDNDSIAQAVANAAKIAKISPENKDFKSLPEPKPYSTAIKFEDFISKATIETTPEQRAEYAKLAIDSAHEVDKKIKAVAGAVSNTINEKIILNSLGIEGYWVSTTGEINLTVLADDGEEETAGWSADNQKDFSKLKIKEVAEKAAQKAADGFGMKVIEPGDYEVVLEPAAVGGFMRFMSIYGFNAMMYQDYMSFIRDKIGEKMFSEKLNLWDDPFNKKQISPIPFDNEGVRKQRLDLIQKGIIKGLTYDTFTANKDGVESTGHNSQFFGRSMPVAQHLFMSEGDSSLDEMIEETKNGILVTHFHYENPVNPPAGVFTGLTRDGAWVIQNGEIQYPLKTLRYTDAIPRFFANIDLIGKYSDLNDTVFFGRNAIAPPVKIPSFKFTGSTEK